MADTSTFVNDAFLKLVIFEKLPIHFLSNETLRSVLNGRFCNIYEIFFIYFLNFIFNKIFYLPFLAALKKSVYLNSVEYFEEKINDTFSHVINELKKMITDRGNISISVTITYIQPRFVLVITAHSVRILKTYYFFLVLNLAKRSLKYNRKIYNLMSLKLIPF